MLQQPEVAAVMNACPRARRVLRPIARMLALRMLDPVKPKRAAAAPAIAVPAEVYVSDASGGDGLGGVVAAKIVKT